MRQYGDVLVFKVNLDLSLRQLELQLGESSTAIRYDKSAR